MTRYLILALSLAACTPAHAAIVSTWSGAGPNACLGKCDFEWFQTTLTDQERADLQAAMAINPEPRRMAIQDGDVFSVMTYYKDGAPAAYRTTTVAALPDPTYGEGWELDGYTVVKLDDCQNWAIIAHGQRVPVHSATPIYFPVALAPETPWIPPHEPWEPPSTPYRPWTPTDPPYVPPTSTPVIPLPWSGALLICGLLFLAGLKRRT